MKHLPKWQRVLAWAIIWLALPFVALWQGWQACRWRLWSGKIYVRVGKVHHGRS